MKVLMMSVLAAVLMSGCGHYGKKACCGSKTECSTEKCKDKCGSECKSKCGSECGTEKPATDKAAPETKP